MTDDPFQPASPSPAHDRTVVIPRPGARAGNRPPSAGLSAQAARAIADGPLPPPPGSNPLLVAAHPLLVLSQQIRSTVQHPNPAALREELARAITQFDGDASRAGVSREDMLAGRYVLCTLLDEAVTSTPWGGGGIWASETLLVRFHNETWGGEKVFALIDNLMADPARHRPLLELVYACLAMGLAGRFRVLSDGNAQLDLLRERIYQALRPGAGEGMPTLSANVAPAAVSRRRWLGSAPFWLAGGIAALIGVASQIGFGLALAQPSDAVFSSILSLRFADRPKPVLAALPKPAPSNRPTLSTLLADEIRQGVLQVAEDGSRSKVVIQGDGFFQPGQASISAQGQAVVDRVARAMKQLPGPVLISGHSDSVPIRTARFPSNWALSKARAETVLARMEPLVGRGRMKAEGRAEAEPVATNATPEGRARNRRVEIQLFAIRGS